MAGCVGVMFAAVIVTAVMMRPDPAQLVSGLCLPRIPQFHAGGLTWTVALIGGVGGTLTILCYGYWIREEGRTGESFLKTCRIDLAAAYAVTALFGIAMVVIGSTVTVEGKGAGLIVTLADRLEGPRSRRAPPGRDGDLAVARVPGACLGRCQVRPSE